MFQPPELSLYEGAVADVPGTSKDVLVEVTGLRLALHDNLLRSQSKDLGLRS